MNNAIANKQSNRFNKVMVLVPTIFYTVFLILPSFGGLFLGLTNWRGMSLNINFIGIRNFTRLFSDPIFYKSIGNSMFLFVVSSLVTFIIAMFFAVILSKDVIIERNIYRSIYFFPSTVPVIIISVMWMVIFNPNFGVLNQLLGLFGFPPQIWLGNPKLVLPSVIVIMIWKLAGFYMILFLAAILNIPQSIFEAAKIDGAGRFRNVFNITIPLIWSVIRTSMVFFLINAENCGFQIIYITTQGGPNRASELMTTYMYKQITEVSQFGYGSAMSSVILTISMAVSLIMLKITDREIYEF